MVNNISFLFLVVICLINSIICSSYNKETTSDSRHLQDEEIIATESPTVTTLSPTIVTLSPTISTSYETTSIVTQSPTLSTESPTLFTASPSLVTVCALPTSPCLATMQPSRSATRLAAALGEGARLRRDERLKFRYHRRAAVR
jgi:hypothetical protein